MWDKQMRTERQIPGQTARPLLRTAERTSVPSSCGKQTQGDDIWLLFPLAAEEERWLSSPLGGRTTFGSSSVAGGGARIKLQQVPRDETDLRRELSQPQSGNFKLFTDLNKNFIVFLSYWWFIWFASWWLDFYKIKRSDWKYEGDVHGRAVWDWEVFMFPDVFMLRFVD